MRLKSKRAWLLPLLAAAVSLLVIGGSLALRFLDLDTYRAEIAAQVRSALKRDLNYQTGDFSFRYGPAFSFSGVTIKEKNGSDDFITAERLTIKIALIPLLRREIVLTRMQLTRPVLHLSRDRSGVFNISDLLEATPGGAPPAIKGIELKNASIRFADSAFSETPLVTELAETDLFLSDLSRGKNCDFKLSGKLKSGTRKVPVFLAGSAKLAPKDAPLGATEVVGRVRCGPLDAAHFWPYYGKYVPFKSLAGDLELETSFKGRLAAFKMKGDLRVTRLRLDYPQVFHALLTPKSLKAAYELELTDRNLDISTVKLNLDGLNVQGSCRLSDIYGKDLRITAKATSNRFNLRDFRQFIPYGIIVKDSADFIEQKIAGGLYRLDEGRLDGRISQILHMELGQNYNILTIRAHVEEGIVNYGSGIPVFSGIKGELELAGKDFSLKGMSGKFGTSPFTMAGRITDYPMLVPCRYLANMNLQPRVAELAWLLGPGRGDKIALSEGSTLKLSGEGTTSLYHLTGEGDLTGASYSLPDLVAKPAGRANTLYFRCSWDKEQFRLLSSLYTLAPLSLSASAVSRYHGGVGVELKTNQFSTAELAPLLPAARKYLPAGKLQASLQAKGPDLNTLTWAGDIALAGFSFKPSDHIKQVTGVNGSLRFNGDSLESSQLSVHLGTSNISGRGSLNGFKSPTLALFFSSPSLDLADLGFPAGKTPLRAERVQGSILLKNDNLQINSLSGQLGKSSLLIKGNVQELKQHPKIDITVVSQHLELEDLTPLFGSQQGSGGSHFTLKAQVNAAEGKAREIPFQRLKCLVMLEDKILYLQPVEFSGLDGEITGKVRMDFGSASPRYQVNCNLQRVSADRFLHALGVKKQEVVGTLSLQGELSAKGESAAELKQSALGALKLKVEHGNIRKFSTLSKVFSILNVSQLFKLQLPDMVSGGMPFNKITGDFAIRDGIATTQNLMLDSNAINISAVGKFDLPRNELDLNIGVQPLQTVDKVVSRIPIVGWILTGKDHSLVTTYFEAKGPIEDPRVTAVPVKSLAKGVLNIFKRVFELPARLFTDTGEVIIGK
jgi:uncharacterized protein involved in outer membrane biogenesis